MTTQRFILVLMVTNYIALHFKINIQDDWLKNEFYHEPKVKSFWLKALVRDLSLLFSCVVTYKK